jgi:hypothetical protein
MELGQRHKVRPIEFQKIGQWRSPRAGSVSARARQICVPADRADAQKIELGNNPGKKLERKLVRAMGFDLASIHAADPRGKRAIPADLKKRPDGWLHAAAKTAAAAVERDFEEGRS